MSLPPSFEARFVSGRMLSPAVRELVFERVDGSPLVFDAGQWVSLILPLAEGEVRRSYSLASAPNGTPRFELAVTHVSGGPGSTFLHAMQPGMIIKAIGPQGFFTRGPKQAAPSLFVATGTGVTPMRSMLLDAIAQKHSAPLWLIFGVRGEEDMLYKEDFARLNQHHKHVHVEYTLSKAHGGWSGRRGYVQTHVRELWTALESGHGAPHAYICGLQRMVGAVRELLRKEMNIPRQQVHSERYD